VKKLTQLFLNFFCRDTDNDIAMFFGMYPLWENSGFSRENDGNNIYGKAHEKYLSQDGSF
jgi:hypothetical protein